MAALPREQNLADPIKLYLKEGREKPVRGHHPWIYSGAVARLEGEPGAGETVMVLDSGGSFLAWAAYSPSSQIRARIWSWDQSQAISADFFRSRIQESLEYRKKIDYLHPLRRLVHAESDGLPGLIADQYGDVLVLQLLSAGMEFWKDEIVPILAEASGCQSVYERSDVQVRQLEGLEPRSGTLLGPVPEPLLEISDGSLKYLVDVYRGHKTGSYLDQRQNRELVGGLCAGKTVLDCFSYSGGFALQALKNGAERITLVDESREALELAQQQVRLNNLEEEKLDYQQGDVFQVLRRFRDQSAQFDLIILDPPKFAPTASLADRAARGYKDINLLAFKLLRPGGLLATFSCSGGISREFFLRILSGAARDAEVNARIQLHMGQSADHSINLSFPEGEYLKGFGIRVD